MKQTAVNWLIEQIKSDQNQKALSASEWIKVIEKAKQMEKEQIIDAFCIGKYLNVDDKEFGEKYYNKLFKSQNNE